MEPLPSAWGRLLRPDGLFLILQLGALGWDVPKVDPSLLRIRSLLVQIPQFVLGVCLQQRCLCPSLGMRVHVHPNKKKKQMGEACPSSSSLETGESQFVPFVQVTKLFGKSCSVIHNLYF